MNPNESCKLFCRLLIVKLFLREEKKKTNLISDCGIPIRSGFAFHFFKSQIRNGTIADLSTNPDSEAEIFAAAKTAGLEAFGL